LVTKTVILLVTSGNTNLDTQVEPSRPRPTWCWVCRV